MNTPTSTPSQQRIIAKRRAWRWLPVLAWMALIFALSSQPTLPSLPDSGYDFLMKKGAHFCSYAVLATLAWRALWPVRGAMLWAWLVAVAYACSDEWHQSFVPGRHPQFTDVLIDASGAALALFVIWVWQRRSLPH